MCHPDILMYFVTIFLYYVIQCAFLYWINQIKQKYLLQSMWQSVAVPCDCWLPAALNITITGCSMWLLATCCTQYHNHWLFHVTVGYLLHSISQSLAVPCDCCLPAALKITINGCSMWLLATCCTQYHHHWLFHVVYLLHSISQVTNNKLQCYFSARSVHWGTMPPPPPNNVHCMLVWGCRRHWNLCPMQLYISCFS